MSAENPADEKKTKKTDENAEETPVEEKPKRTRKKAEPEAAAPEAEPKPKRGRKKAEEAAAEPAEAPVVAEEVEAEAEQVEAEPEQIAEQASEEAAPAEEPVAAEPESEEPAAETPSDAQPATDEAATEQPRGPQRGPKKKSKRLPRAQRHKHVKPRRERPAEREPITRLPKPGFERGRSQQRRGVVVSAAMDKTIVVRVDSVKAHPKYKKVIRRSVKFHAHDEQNQAKAGDVVCIVETRPLSKTKRWRLAEVIEVAQ
jgi:small subunit ribosomal protein S17